MNNPLSGIRVGTGAGFSDDRIEPAVELAERGGVDYLSPRTCMARASPT